MTTTPQLWRDEQTANTTTNGLAPKIVAMPDGNFAVFWLATTNTGAASSPGDNIIGQVYDPFGNKIGSEFRAESTINADISDNFDVQIKPDGTFLVAYEVDSSSVFVADFTVDENGSTMGTTGRVASEDPGEEIGDPSLTVSQDGGYLVSYQVITDTLVETRGRAFDGNGNASGELTYTSVVDANDAANDGDQETASAALSNGTYVVVGHVFENGAGGQDGLSFRLVDANGNPMSSARGVGGTTATISPDTEPSVAALNGGGFVIAWKQQSGADTDIAFLRYNNNGQSQGPVELAGDSSASDNARNPSITGLDDGGFMITWVDGLGLGTRAVHAQRYDADGDTVGAEFVVESPAAITTYEDPDIQVLDDGRIAVAWQQTFAITTNSVEFAIYDPRGDLINGKNNAPDVIVAGAGRTTVKGDGFFGDIGNGGDDILYAYGEGDALFGQKGDDQLFGAAGNDTLVGGEGADFMDGGGGQDTVLYRESSEGVSANLQFGQFSGGDAEGDVVSNVEHLSGSNYDDHLTGNEKNNILRGLDGDDELHGRLGDDILVGGKGADFLNGGSGHHDQVDFIESDSGVDIGVNNGALNTGGDAEGDIFYGIEDLSGSNFDDEITGNSVKNRLIGRDGNDTINAASNDDFVLGGEGDDMLTGSRGADFLDGGLGIDTTNYSNSDLRVTVDLDDGSGRGFANGSGHGSGDVLVNIENIFGSKYNDSLTGDSQDNEINGFLGNDQIFGEEGDDNLKGHKGDDIINGGEGNDVMTGGEGRDIFQFTDLNWGYDRITDWQDGLDLLDFSSLGLNPAIDLIFSDYGGSTLIKLKSDPDQTIWIEDLDVSQIDESDFLYVSALTAPDPAEGLSIPSNDGEYLHYGESHADDIMYLLGEEAASHANAKELVESPAIEDFSAANVMPDASSDFDYAM